MRRRVAILLLATLAIVGAGAFMLAPVVYSPKGFTMCNLLNGCHDGVLASYESPSCALFGVGAGTGVSVNIDQPFMTGKGGYSAPPLGYHLGCPSVPSDWKPFYEG